MVVRDLTALASNREASVLLVRRSRLGRGRCAAARRQPAHPAVDGGRALIPFAWACGDGHRVAGCLLMVRWRRRRETGTNGQADWERVSAAVRASREHRLAALEGQEPLVDELTAVLFEADPIGLNFETNTDEYAAEAQSIALRLPEVSDLDQLRELVHQEFVRWFDADLAGNPSRYTALAQKILTVWHRHHPLDVPAAIRVMSDYDCWPTWDEETGRNIDPESLPITRRLVRHLNAWAARYDASLNRSDPSRSKMSDPQGFAAHGRLLTDGLSRELQGICRIRYRDID